MTDAALAARLRAWRDETPGVAHRIHLNNAGAGLMPAPVLRSMVEHLEREAEIGGYEAADAAAAEIEAGYGALADLVGAAPRNIAVVANSTAAFIQALSVFDFSPRDAIITSRCDYTSNQIQYLSLTERLGVEIVHAADLASGGVDPDAVRDAIVAARARGRRPLVALSWVPTNSGLVQDAKGVGAVCAETDTPYLLDACQAVGQMVIDVERLHCDYLAASARKFLRGPRGVGFLYASDRALGRGDFPLYVDMRGARWVGDRAFEVHPTARRFEDWEFPYALVLGQAAAARYAAAVGVETASGRAWELAARLRAGLERLPGTRVLDRGTTRCALVTVAFDTVEAATIQRFLLARGVNSVLSVREFGRFDFGEKAVEVAIRLSPHYYNTEEEIETALEAIEEALAAEG